MTKLEEKVSGELGLIPVIKELRFAVENLNKSVLVLQTKDAMRSGIWGAIAGAVSSAVLWLIQHMK